MAEWDQISEVLECIGIEDEFDAIRDRAEELAEMPDPPVPQNGDDAPLEIPILPPRTPRERFAEFK